MCDVVERHRKEIESFCLTEGLCAERLFHEAVSFNRTQAFIQLVRDGENHGLLDETPAPVLLHIIEEPDNRIRIETTEHTRNVLGDCSVSAAYVQLREAMRWIIQDISERCEQAEQTDDFSRGRALAYWEVLEMIRNRLYVMNVEDVI